MNLGTGVIQTIDLKIEIVIRKRIDLYNYILPSRDSSVIDGTRELVVPRNI